MKRLSLIFLALLVVACASSAQTIYYMDEATLQWDAVTTDVDGTPWLPSDVVEYEVYTWDMGGPAPNPDSVAGWNYVGVTTAVELLIVFEHRTEWAVAVRLKVTDAGSNERYSTLAWSGNPDDCQGGVPFFYTPLPGLDRPTALRDSGM